MKKFKERFKENYREAYKEHIEANQEKISAYRGDEEKSRT
jgi:hypothetical protein